VKHRWVKEKNGNLKNWYSGYCNGPICAECGAQPCKHCQPECFEEECSGREGFKVYVADRIMNDKMLGIRWGDKRLYIGLWFITICFSFRGLFSYCCDVEDDDD